MVSGVGRPRVSGSVQQYAPASSAALANTSTGSWSLMVPRRTTAGAATPPTRAAVDDRPTARLRTDVGKSSAQYTKTIEKADETANLPSSALACAGANLPGADTRCCARLGSTKANSKQSN